MFSYGQQRKAAKEPAVVNAEKFMKAILDSDLHSLYSQMDPKILFNSPMGVFHGRPHVKAWLMFELGVLQGHKIEHVETKSQDGLRVARTTWTVGALRFTDTITLSQVLSIKAVRRTLHRDWKTQKEKEAADALLLSWTGPYFSKYCSQKPRSIDNRALVLPVLDYAYMGVTQVRELLTTKPKGGKEIQETSIALHFLQSLSEKERNESQADKNNQAEKDKLSFGVPDKDEITVQARGRDGERAAIVIDRNALGGDGDKITSLEDGEVVVKEDRMRFVCSGLKLNNNEIDDATELDMVAKLYLVNAFYFLNIVDLSSNKLTKVPDLSQFPITGLYLHDNQISDFEETEKLGELSQLQSLTLFGNPIQSATSDARNYKFRILALFWRPPEPPQPRSKSPPMTPFEKAQKERDRSASLAAKEDESGEAARLPTSPTRSRRAFTPGGAMRRTPSAGARRTPSASRPPSAAVVAQRQREEDRRTKGYLALRTLDHSVVSPIEMEAVQRYHGLSTTQAKGRPKSASRK